MDTLKRWPQAATARRRFITPWFDALGAAKERNEAHEWSVRDERVAVCDLVTSVHALLDAQWRLQSFFFNSYSAASASRGVI